MEKEKIKSSLEKSWKMNISQEVMEKSWNLDFL